MADAKAATRARAALATRLAANRLAAAVVDLYKPFHPVVPTAVMRLDVLLRTVDLAAVARRPTEARRALDHVERVWRNLSTKPPVAGSEAQQSFTKEVDAVQRAMHRGDFAALHRAALTALEGVDILENLYKLPTGGGGAGPR